MASEAPVTRRAMFARLLRDRDGFVIVTVALLLVVLIGLGGLAVETGLWYMIKRVNQTAADTAALSGAFEKLAGQPYSDMCGFAQRDATRNGFVFAAFTCPVSTPACSSPASGQMCANNPPVLGTSAGNANAFEVILAQNQNSFLASLYLPSVTIDTRAVALISKLDDACLLSLDPTAPDAIFIKGGGGAPANINMPNCSIVADSSDPHSIHFQGSAGLIADTLVTHGGVFQTGAAANIQLLGSPAHTNAPVVPDPYAPNAQGVCSGSPCLIHIFLTTEMPVTPCGATTGSCVVQSDNVLLKGDITLAANTQIHTVGGQWQIKNQIVNLSPGTYWVTDGDLQLGANGFLECTLCNPATGVGITIIFTISTGTTVGSLQMLANTNVGTPTFPNFNAPTSGAYKGLLFIQDSNGLPNGTTWNSGTFQGGPNTVLNGLIYTPKSQITFNGNPAAGGTGCLLVVADKVTLSGDSHLVSTGCQAAGVTPPNVQTVALTE